MNKRQRYTQKEDDIILKCVDENPDNLIVAFEVASKLLKIRTTSAINNRYYTIIKPKHNNIAVASKKGIVRLGKNSRRKYIVPNAKTIKDAMLYASVSQLSKQKAIEFLLSKISDEDKSKLLIKIANKIAKS